jgi:hypothetical protein
MSLHRLTGSTLNLSVTLIVLLTLVLPSQHQVPQDISLTNILADSTQLVSCSHSESIKTFIYGTTLCSIKAIIIPDMTESEYGSLLDTCTMAISRSFSDYGNYNSYDDFGVRVKVTNGGISSEVLSKVNTQCTYGFCSYRFGNVVEQYLMITRGSASSLMLASINGLLAVDCLMGNVTNSEALEILYQVMLYNCGSQLTKATSGMPCSALVTTLDVAYEDPLRLSLIVLGSAYMFWILIDIAISLRKSSDDLAEGILNPQFKQ